MTGIKKRRLIQNIIDKIRRSYWKKRVLKKAKVCGENLTINRKTLVNSNTCLGHNITLNGLIVMGGGKITIGNHCHIGTDCLIIAQNHNYDNGNAIPFDDTYIYKDIEIGDFVWIGARVMILPGTKIGKGAIIQGGSVVHGEIPDYAIAGGNPAKVFKYRDIEHFKKLEEEGKFN